MLYFTLHSYAMGTLALIAGDEGLEQIRFEGTAPGEAVLKPDHPVLTETGRQIDAYFARELRDFDLPIALKGTAFQVAAWRALRQIPYGATRSYAEQAKAIGSPTAVRAVGAANGRNPIPIVIPCHRVIGSNGRLVGFGGGLPLKRYLLDLENRPRLMVRDEDAKDRPGGSRESTETHETQNRWLFFPPPDHI